jgi:hypothetical protein
MPHLVEMIKDFSPSDFVLLGVETTHRAELARAYVESIGASWPILMDDQEAVGKLYEVPGVPTNVFVDPSGRILFRSVGFREGDERIIAETIASMVERRPASG